MRAMLLIAGVALCAHLHAQVVITEVMFNPAQGDRFEFIEIANEGAVPVDLEGWSFSNGVTLTFESATLAAGQHAVVCRSVDDFRMAYPDVPETTILGQYEGRLDNGGERLTLSNTGGEIVETLRYDDNPPWDFLADGFGASLERLCTTASASLPENWRASVVPEDPETEFGGTPGVPRQEPLCPPVFADKPRVFLSEIHYHAVLEEAIEDEYEYVEIHNGGDSAVDLAGWRLAAGVDFEFPAGATIGAGGYAVIARDPEKIAAVDGYSIPAAALFGPYERTLDNGGEKIALVSAAGQGVDSVNYDDSAPWPIAADALGAGASWLREDLLPIEDHRHKGHSLERISFEVPASEVANWAPSPLDGMTPGQPNASASETLTPIVDDIDLTVLGSEDELIRAGEEVEISVEFAPQLPTSATIEYFVEDLEADDEVIETAELMEADGRLRALLPGQRDNTIVHYRVLADLGAGSEVVSPRASDPQDWHAYFVAPVIETETRVYQLFIGRRNWGQLNRNIAGNRVAGCEFHPTWNNREPAFFVHNGRVRPAQVRFQGSRWNRANGPSINGWRVAGPNPGPVAVRSWRVALPRYSQLGGRDVLTLNKLTQGCPGYNAGVGYSLFAQADIPSAQTRFVQLHINGQYYHYMMEYERPGESLIRRYNREMRDKYPDRPREKVGNLFKSVGCTCDEGPYGWGDWRILNNFCGHEARDRYAATYDRKTNSWDTPDALIQLIEDMHRARRDGVDAMRQFVLDNFDLELVLSYIAIINWQVPFDDMFQNHFVYQRTSDGKWMLMPWDLDRNFGEWQSFNSSFLMGKQGDPSNRSGWWHRLKDTVLVAFEDEYLDHLLFLNNTILHPDNVQKEIDRVTAESNQAEASAAPAGLNCGTFAGRAGSFRQFAIQRHNLINTRLAGVNVDAGADVTVYVGEVAQLDARESEPDPGPDVTYTWSSGAEGDFPVVTFDEPGVYELTLTVTTRDIPFTDTVVVTVLERPALAFVETDGVVVMEGESFTDNIRREDVEDAWWDVGTEVAGFSGDGYMLAAGDRRRAFSSNYAGRLPRTSLCRVVQYTRHVPRVATWLRPRHAQRHRARRHRRTRAWRARRDRLRSRRGKLPMVEHQARRRSTRARRRDRGTAPGVGVDPRERLHSRQDRHDSRHGVRP